MTKNHYLILLACMLMTTLVFIGPLFYFFVAGGDAGFYVMDHHKGIKLPNGTSSYLFLKDDAVTSMRMKEWERGFVYRARINSRVNNVYVDENNSTLTIDGGAELMASVRGNSAVYVRSYDPIVAWYMVYAIWER